jgi:rhodanese-related sulfurtransferase
VQQYAKVPQPEGTMLIDARPYKPKYANGHIPTAVSIPDSQFEKMTDKLPQDKNTLLIFYCEGPT